MRSSAGGNNLSRQKELITVNYPLTLHQLSCAKNKKKHSLSPDPECYSSKVEY